MNQDLIDRLQRAESTPYGKARSALLEDVVRRADAEEADDLAFYSRLALVTAYVMGGEPRKSLVPFARCVADWDADPGKYQDYSHLFHWCFKYAPSTLTKFPEVPLDRAYAVLDDMERRWRVSGHSMHAVHQHRWLVAHHIGDTETAAEQFRLWSTAPRDDLSDCVGCDPTSKVHHLTGVGRTADAVALAVNVLDGQLTCAEQPQQMLTALLPAYVAEGMYSEAVDAHRKGYRILRGRVGELSEHADHVVFLARTGNELKAVELIERHLNELADPPSPFAEMQFAAAASLALSRVDGGLMIRRPQSPPVAAAEFASELAGRALELAAQFDARNGTEHRSDQVRAMLTAEPWVEYLPLSETARRAQLRKQAVAEEVPADEPAPLPTPTGRGWLDRAEDCWQRGRADEAIAAWQSYSQEVPESGWTTLDRARVLDGRGLMAQDQPEVALEAWREALTLYSELGEDVRVLRDRGRIGRMLCSVGETEEGLATGEEPLRWLISNDEPHRRAGWQDSLAHMYATAGRYEDAVRELAEVLKQPDLDNELHASSAILQCNLLAQLGRFEEAEEAATAGLRTANDLARSFAYRQRGRVRQELGRPAEAAEDLTEAVALAVGTSGLEVHVALCQLELARAYLLTGRPLEAAETGEETLRVLGSDPELADPLADVRELLIDAYRALGELESALTKVREVLASVPAEADVHPHWQAMMRQDEGMLLEQLDRDSEAIESFLTAASYYGTAEQPVDQVQAIRLAAQSARYTGDFAQATSLIERALPLLESLPPADERVLFQTAGVHWDRALIALQQGETEVAVRYASQAAEYYERGGYEDQHTNARLLVAEHGTTDEKLVEEIFTSLPTGHDLWYRAGWLLADRLRAQGRAQEANSLEAQLTE